MSDTATGDTGSDAPVLIERDGSIETWTINLPDERNPISGDDVVDALEAAANRVNRDTSVQAVILTGAGKAFSAGGNVKQMVDRVPPFGGPVPASRDGYRYGIQRIPKALYTCDVPLIAAVNGAAIGAGCDLATMCDIRVASTKAFFAESFVKVGIIPGDGGAFFLPRAVGAARAAEMMFTGDRIDAQTALDWGLVSRVVEPDELLPTAREIAQRIAVNPSHAVRLAKKLYREAQRGMDLDSVLELSAAFQAIAHTTDDQLEAVTALVEKRDPNFTGN
ncbi:crotonase/enoyl-CoA hydratase family protein [Granulicoccus phenolivorans]|uniref:crotonase/enoyl-CoA hydratase family protein n=1 Tax=Granulicoccus phenolivorans TaxID=266854 RepID=UPI00041CB87A|nr:crotonase/enoyl-CoA hydratase family protein [Granulicoccus phenolivorans]